MDRAYLLDRAVADGRLHPETKQIALKCTSGALFDTCGQSLKRYVALLRCVYRGLVMLTAIAAVGIVIFFFTTLLGQYPLFLVGSTLTFFGFGILSLTVSIATVILESRLAALAPVMNSESCLRALKLIETNILEVLAWRDIALTERDVLAEFDLEIMSALAEAVSGATRRVADEAEYQAACRKVYGIATDIPASAANTEPTIQPTKD